MIVLGLTGGIASGKSTVSHFLREDGRYPIIDADRLAHALVQPGGCALDQIVSAFGPDILTPQGEMDRQKMGQLISRDPEAKQKLDEITHPAIKERVAAQIAQYDQQGEKVVVYDCPLLFESGSDAQTDGFLLINATTALRVRRLMTRDHMSETTALGRIAIQMSDEEKMMRAKKTGKPTVVIQNNQGLDDLKSALWDGLAKLMVQFGH